MGWLVLNQPVERWIRDSVVRGGLRVLDLDAGAATDAGALGHDLVPDPVDRLLIATARGAEMPIATRDGRILDFASRTRLVRIHDASR